MIDIRKYKSGEEEKLFEIFYNTIRKINIQDYTNEQVKAWAPDDYDESRWRERIKGINPFVALLKNEIVGYADIQKDGYIDHFFCHHKFQGKGIGKTLMSRIFEAGEELKVTRYYSEVSITAKPFFEHFGFIVIREQEVEVRGVKLKNYLMEKVVTSG